MIQRADALPALLPAFAGRLGDLALRPVHPRADAPAIRLLISGTKGSKAPLRLLPGLTLHEADGVGDAARGGDPAGRGGAVGAARKGRKPGTREGRSGSSKIAHVGNLASEDRQLCVMVAIWPSDCLGTEFGTSRSIPVLSFLYAHTHDLVVTSLSEVARSRERANRTYNIHSVLAY